ncbi:MAG TPA: N-methyl-L-tryptophan oxidase [Rubrobacteraceae bacterium]|nr:N-methyl-L-tryptophan oxidase [Rubrobacteraceae bacterium]
MSVTYSGRYDAIVVGVGGMGSATSYYLARRGKRVLGLERFGIPHSMGSSHGHTRIIRLAYYEHPSYVLLLQRAYELWREIQRTAGERLLHITSSIDAGPEDSWVFKGSWESCRLHDLPHEVLTGAELHRRYPGYHLPADHLALVQPEGGFLTPEKCIVSYVMAAQALGAEIHGHEQVLEWQPLEGGVRVRTDRGVYEADKLVITAGAWDGELLDVLEGLAVPERQVLAWLQPTRPEYFRPNAFPVFNLLVDEGRFYGFPLHGVPGFKFGKYHHLEEKVDPETVDREAHDYDERLLRDFAERYFPDGCGPTMDLQTCMFTNTPDNHFIIDVHPEYDQVSFASPCSGHGYKFASVIGEIMADLADTGITRHDVSLFRLDRLTSTSRRLPGRAHPTMGTTNHEAHQQNGRSRSFPRVPEIRPFW